MTTVQIELPNDVVEHVDDAELQTLVQEAVFVRWYERGRLWSGKAAQLLGISRRAFLDLLGSYNVSVFDETMNVEDELQRARAAVSPKDGLKTTGQRGFPD